jgi:hypothetical protein
MLDGRLPNPAEGLGRPPLRLPIAPVLDEVQELLVRHVMDVDGEGGHVHHEARHLVVPSEGDLARTGTERGTPGRDRDALRARRAAARKRRRTGRRSLVPVRQLVPEIEQGLLVHRLVLEDREHGLRLVQQRMAGLLERGVGKRVEDEIVAGLGKPLYVGSRWPLGRLAAVGGALAVRVDAAREQALEVGVDARTPERLLHQRVHAESWQVALIEHDRVPERDRPRVVGLRPDDVEQRACPPPVLTILVGQRFPVEGRGLDEHGYTSAI